MKNSQNRMFSKTHHLTFSPPHHLKPFRIFGYEVSSRNANNSKFEFVEGSLGQLFTNLYKALFDYSNSELLAFLEETSNPNIRNGLEKFKFFLLSGHTKTNMYMSFEYGKEGKGNIPIWEFVKSVALESNYYYQTNRSTLFNIYYPSRNNRNHFTKIRLLEYIIDNNSGLSKKNNFIPITLIINDFIKAGYTYEIIIEELNLLYTSGLIFTNDFVSDIETKATVELSNEIGITQSGVYYIKNLITKFFYYDLILQDTPIYNEKAFDEITNAFPESDSNGNRDLLKRKKVAELFVEYLNEQETLDHNRKELDYGIKCLDKQIIKTIKEAGLKYELERLDRVLVDK